MGKRSAWALVLAIALGSLVVAGGVEVAGPLGMVANSATYSVTVFDTATDTVLGSVSIPITDAIDIVAIGDVAIVGNLGFVTNFRSEVWVIDLTTSPPSLASGANPIPISNKGEDISVSPDQKFLVVVDGGNPQPISVIDIALRSEIITFSLGDDHNSVDVCSDGSVLVTSSLTGNVHRLTIDGAGNLTDTGDVLFSGGSDVTEFPGGPNNVFCAPDGNSGIVIRRAAGEILSFTIPGLTLVNIRSLSGNFGISGFVNRAGDRLYARSNGAVDVFDYNSATAAIGLVPLFSIPIFDALTYYGMDQMVISPDGSKLYVSQPSALNVYDAHTLVLLTAITAPEISAPTGVVIESLLEVYVDIKPGSDPNSINLGKHGLLPVAILGSPEFDVETINPETIELGGVSLAERGSKKKLKLAFSLEDVNGDGFTDMITFFDVQTLVIGGVLEDTTVVLTLTATLHDGTPIMGTDSVKIVHY